MNSRPPLPQSGFVRQLWLAAAAMVVMAVGVISGLQALALDREVADRQREALQLSRATLQLQLASAGLRDAQSRIGREVLAAASGSTTSFDRTALTRLSDELNARVAAVASGGDAPGRVRVGELGIALDGYAASLARTGGADASSSPGGALRERIVELQRRFEIVEQRLAAVIADTQARTDTLQVDADRAADRKNTSRAIFIVATVIAVALLIAMSVRTMRSNNLVLDRLAQLAQEDPLTGIPNRRGLDERLPVEFARAERSGLALTFVMIDLDFFKKYNDRRGHAAGDALLRGAAQAWARQLRPTDLIARYGGEEFSLLLPACDADQAVLLVDRLRRLVPDHQTFSAGVACWDQEENASDLMQRADQALLQAKKGGRNRTMIAGREPQVTLPLQHA